jgi:hypothetical protein
LPTAGHNDANDPTATWTSGKTGMSLSQSTPLPEGAFKRLRCRPDPLGADMRRREFIGALIGGAAAARPLAGIAAVLAPGSSRAQTQPGGGMRRIGALLALLENDLMGQTRAKALVEALGALNWKSATASTGAGP